MNHDTMTSPLQDASVPLLSASSIVSDNRNDTANAFTPAEADRGSGRESPSRASLPPPPAPVLIRTNETEHGHPGAINCTTWTLTGTMSLLQWFLWLGAVLLQTGNAFMFRYAYPDEGLPAEAWLAAMLLYLLASITAECIVHRLVESTERPLWGFRRPRRDDVKMAIPAILYWICVPLFGTAMVDLSFRTYVLEWHVRVLLVAAVSVYMIRRKYNIFQWICLAMIAASEDLEVHYEYGTSEDNTVWHFRFSEIVGSLSIVLAILINAVALVFTERVLKESQSATDSANGIPSVSMWRRSTQLSFFLFLSHIINVLVERHRAARHDPLFHGFTVSTWFFVGFQTVVALWAIPLLKYTDSVYKTLTVSTSLFLVDVLRGMFESEWHGVAGSGGRTSQMILAILIALPSIYWFINHSSAATATQAAPTEESGGENALEMGTTEYAKINTTDPNEESGLGSLVLSEDDGSAVGVARL